MAEEQEYAVEVDGVYKDFLLPHEKTSSIKGIFTNILQSNAWRTKETQHALDDISFKIKKGEFFGIVGRNGSGKSTMLKILAGIYQPTKGTVKVKGKLVPFIELGVGFNPELTGRENVNLNGAMLGFSRKEVDAMYQDIVDFAEIEKFMDQKLKNYSSGMQVRLAFSIATRAKADVLLVDEVLAVGDADFQRKCFDYFQKLKGSGTTVVFVTHDMNAVREYCDRAIMIEQSKMVVSGDADKASKAYTRMFMDAPSKNNKDRESLRWGDETVTYTKISVTEPVNDTDDVVIHLEAQAHKDVEKPVFGFMIKNATKTAITGTNTLIEHKKIPLMKAGQTIQLSWSIPNIFNDGIHFVEPAIVYKGTTQIADWWDEAATFTIKREQKTAYLVSPPVGLTISQPK